MMPVTGEVDSYYYHFNHYAHIEGTQEIDYVSESRKRDGRAKQLKPPRTDADVRRILGDTDDASVPIYKDPSSLNVGTGSRTVATAVFNITEKKLNIYRTCPRAPSYPCCSIPFL